MLLLEADSGDAAEVLSALGEFTDQFRVTWVGSLRSAVDALVDSDFDCLIVGLGLPDARGLEVVEVLREAASGAALIVLTDGDDAMLGFRAIQGGVHEFLVRSELSSRNPHDLCLAVQYAIERARLTSELRLAEERSRSLSAIVESTADAILTQSPSGVILTWNRGAEELYGYSADEVVGRQGNLLHPWDEQESTRLAGSLHRGQTLRGLETVHRTKNDEHIHVSLTISPLRGPGDEPTGVSVIARDISDRRLLEDELTKQAMRDGLTGLPNRPLLMDRLEQALAEAARSGQPVAVILLGLDRFKEISDSRGHRVGDHLLTEVTSRVSGVVSPADTVARLGHEEFVVMCRNTDGAAAERVATRISDVLRESVRISGEAVGVTASVGLAVCPPVAAHAELLLQYADAAMYEAKSRGGDRVQVFDVAFASHSHRRLDLIDDLRAALHEDVLALHYQPIVDMTDGRLVGVEALVRWDHPDRGAVPPTVFVPLAEETGLIAQLDRWVLQRACRDAVTLRESGILPADGGMSINLSARTVSHRHLGDLVRETAADRHLPAESLVFEVTETAVLQDPIAARRALETVRGMGVGVALDDFGTGYSSLTFLRQLPVTHLKIDRSFVSNITKEADDRAIAACIVDLAHRLDIQVIAEGVETTDQLTVLRELGCTTGQGYLWSRALPLEKLSRLPLALGHAAGPPAQRHPPGDVVRPPSRTSGA